MLDTGHLTYFGVKKCGLYRASNSHAHGVLLEETFDLISSWVNNRPLSLTIPWSPETKTNKNKIYCKDIKKSEITKDFLVILWKSDTDSRGSMWGASEDSHLGTSGVFEQSADYGGKKVIWGRPCYYWVVPEKNIVASIKFEHSLCDTELFEDYVVNCINLRVDHEKRKKTSTEKGFTRIECEDNAGVKYAYRFNVGLKVVSSFDTELVKLASKVTHIVKREVVEVNTNDERAKWLQLFNDVVPFVNGNSKSKKRKIEFKFESKPTLAEIKQIIAKNAKENRGKTEWENVGFATDSGITWVDSYRLKEIMLVERNPNSVLSAQEILNAIQKDRKNLLRFFQEAESDSTARAG